MSTDPDTFNHTHAEDCDCPACTTCDACGVRPNGHGHFGLYCLPCSELPYGHSA
jgi:hypothetical protein